MKFRRISMFAVFVTAALAVAGCGGGTPPAQAPSAEAPAAVPASEAPAPASTSEAPTPVEPLAAKPRTAPAAKPSPVEREAEPVAQAPEEARAPEEMIVVTLPPGTSVDLVMVDPIGSRTSKAGDTFKARVAKDVVYEGRVALPQGSTVTGVIMEAAPLGKIGGTAKLVAAFTGAVLPSGDALPIRATLSRTGKSESGKDAATIGGAAAVGGLLGRALSKDDKAKGTLLGALAGAAAGGAVAAKTKGEEIELPAGTELTIETEEPIEIHIRP